MRANAQEATFTVPKSVIEHISVTLREALAIASTSTKDSNVAEVRFEVDDLRAWEVFIFWAYKHCLPRAIDVSTDSKTQGHFWVHAWLFGHKYDIPTFQDLVMLELLKWCEAHSFNLCLAGRAFRNTEPGSKLRTLILEEVVHMLQGIGSISWSSLQGLWVIPGFSTAMFGMLQWHEEGKYSSERFEIGVDEVRAEWKKFMVGNGPVKHWALDTE